MTVTKERVIGFLDTITEWCVYILLFAVTFSNSLVEIVSTTMIVAWVLGLVLGRDTGKLKFPAAFMLAAYFVWVLLSCFNSAYPSESFRGIFKALQYGLVFMALATRIWNSKSISRFLYFAAGAVILAGANGLFQYFTGGDLLRGRTLIPDDYLKRISSSFIHPNDFGAYLMVMASLFISIIFTSANSTKKTAIFSLALTVSIICLFLTGSRGAWISFAGAFIVVGMLKGKKIAALFIGILIAIFILLPPSSRQRIYETANTETGTSWERVMLWRGTVDMIKEHPVLGFGVNTFSKHFPDYKPKGYIDDRYAHNCYLQMAAEIGIIGALFFILFILTGLFCSLGGILSMPQGERKCLAIGLFSGSAGFAINSAVDTHLFSLTLAVLFSVLLGAVISVSRKEAS